MKMEGYAPPTVNLKILSFLLLSLPFFSTKFAQLLFLVIENFPLSRIQMNTHENYFALAKSWWHLLPVNFSIFLDSNHSTNFLANCNMITNSNCLSWKQHKSTEQSTGYQLENLYPEHVTSPQIVTSSSLSLYSVMMKPRTFQKHSLIAIAPSHDFRRQFGLQEYFNCIGVALRPSSVSSSNPNLNLLRAPYNTKVSNSSIQT